MADKRPDIGEVLAHYGATNRKRMISCLLHEDNTPSCSVDYGDDLWSCHSCGEGGDSWTLIMKKEGLDFVGAKAYAALVGIADGSAGSGGPVVSGSAYGRRREVPPQSGNRSGDGKYVPSWHRH